MKTWSDRLLWWMFYISPFIALLFLMFQINTNVIYGDEFYFVPIVADAMRGRGIMSIVLAQLNEHRIVFPLFIISSLAIFTQWSVQYELLLSPFFALFNYFVLNLIGSRSLPGVSVTARRILSFVCALIIFSWAQYENWSQGITFVYYLVEFCLVAGVLVLYMGRRGWTDLLIAALLCFIATFSLSHGLFTWVALLPFFFVKPASGASIDKMKTKIFVWLISALLTVALFSFHYQSQQWVVWGIPPIGNLTSFFLVMLGASVFEIHIIPAAFLTGGIMLIVLLFYFINFLTNSRGYLAYALPWLCLCFFVLLSVFATSVGRWSLGTQYAFMPRYTTTTQFFVIALIYLTILYFSSKKMSLFLPIISVILLGLLYPVAGINIVEDWYNKALALREGGACLTYYSVAPTKCLDILGHSRIDGESVRNYAGILDEIGYIKTNR